MSPPSHESAFERLEAEWADLRRAFEDRLVDTHRGLPIRDEDYPERRIAFANLLAGFPEEDLTVEQHAGLACIRSALGWFDENEPVAGLIEHESAHSEEHHVAASRRAVYDAFGRAAASVEVGTETMDRLTAFARLATADDPSERRAVFAAMAPVWRAVDGDGDEASPYRRLIEASAERWERHGSVIEANAAVLGLAPGAFEPMLHRILSIGHRVVCDAAGLDDGRRIEPWDYRYVVGGAQRLLRHAVPRHRLRPINDAHLRSLGADPERLAIGYDIFPREGRPVIPVAFTTGGRPGPWVFATYREGGLDALSELLHESGHAVHFAAIRTRPAFAEPPADHAAFIEAIGELIGWDAGETAFQEHHLGEAVEPRLATLDRYGGVLLDACWALFEIELHRSPRRRPNDVWAEIVADGLGIEPHPEWSWWALRGQLIDSPGYLANYVLAAVAAAAIRGRIRELRGDWSAGDAGWYGFVSERLLRFGGERSPGVVLHDLLGVPLTEQPLLDDLAGAG